MAGCSVVVLISGSGSNLQALIDAVAANAPYRIAAVISNRADAYGLQRARKANIDTQVIDHKEYADRESYDQALMAAIDGFSPDLVLLAGFMRILTDGFVRHFSGRMLNIHPSLLPKFKGLHTHQKAIDAGETIHGASVHFVTEELDGGPLIVQARVPISRNDTAEELAARVLKREHIIYPLGVKWFAEGRLSLQQGRVMLEGNPLAGPLVFDYI